jgi:hypothetical protein
MFELTNMNNNPEISNELQEVILILVNGNKIKLEDKNFKYSLSDEIFNLFIEIIDTDASDEEIKNAFKQSNPKRYRYVNLDKCVALFKYLTNFSINDIRIERRTRIEVINNKTNYDIWFRIFDANIQDLEQKEYISGNQLTKEGREYLEDLTKKPLLIGKSKQIIDISNYK